GEEAGQGNAEEGPVADDEAQAALGDDKSEAHRERAEALAHQAFVAARAFELLALEGAACEATRPGFAAGAHVEAHFDRDVAAFGGEADDRCDEAGEEGVAS